MDVWADSTSRSTAWGGWEPARFLKKAVGVESFDDEFGILDDDRCIDTRTLPPARALPRQPHISFAILTHADWCAIGTVARCEAGLLAVVGTVGAGARMIW